MLDEEQKKFNKKEAQMLSFQLMGFVRALQKYCCNYYDYENMDCVILVLNQIGNIADDLYDVLDGHEVFKEVLLKKVRNI